MTSASRPAAGLGRLASTGRAAGPDRAGAQSVVGVHLVGVHHVGVPVRNLEESLTWYRDVFGLSPSFIQRSHGPQASQTVQLPDADLRFAFLEVGPVVIELLEYTNPRGRDFALRNCDVGAMHICLEVDDIDDAFRRLADVGTDFSIAPTTHGPGPVEGHRCCYFRDPNGLQFELWQRA